MTINFDYPLWLLVLISVFAVAWCTQMAMQLLVWLRPVRRCRKEKKGEVNFTNEQPPVSIIIYAHNQVEDLTCNVPELLNQDYPDFEVIVVDDCSRDHTLEELERMEQRMDRLFHTKIDDRARTLSHRKLALVLGLKAAHNDVIITTQAQCCPDDRHWIASMVRNFTPKTDVVIGPVAYERRTSLVSQFCSYDLFHRLMQMFGLTLGVKAHAGWGVNMAFRKSLFFAEHKDSNWLSYHIHPGEDDLFVSAVARNNNVAVEISPSSLMIDHETPLKNGWSQSRLNRAYTSRRYAVSIRVTKFLDNFTRYLAVFSGLAIAAYGFRVHYWGLMGVALALLLIRALGVSLIPYFTARSLRIRRYWLAPLLCDLMIPIVDVWYFFKSIIKDSNFHTCRIR